MTTSKRDDEMPLRDPHVEAAWRAASSEEPPPALDAAILAAARREVAAGPQPIAAHDARAVRSVRRQWWPLAAAATIGAIAAGLLQLVPHDELVAPGIDSGVVTDMPAAPAPSLPQVAAPPMPDDARKDAASAGAGSMRPAPPAQVARKTAPAVSMNAPAAPTNAQQDAGAVPPTVATLPEPFPAAEPKREASPAVGSSKADTAGMADARPAAALPPAGRAVAPASPMEPPAARLAASGGSAEPAQARGDAAPVAKLASEPTPAAPSASGGAARSATDREFARPVPQARVAAEAPRAEAATSVRARDRAPLPVAEWIALIRRLRAEGKTDEAVRELAAFRAAHADHERLLPADLRQWRPAEK